MILAAVLGASAYTREAPSKPAPDPDQAEDLIRETARDFATLRSRMGTRLRGAREGLRTASRVLPPLKEPVWVDFRAYWTDLRKMEAAFIHPERGESFASARSRWQYDYIRLREDLLSARSAAQGAAEGLDSAGRTLESCRSRLDRARLLLGRSHIGGVDALRSELKALDKEMNAWKGSVFGGLQDKVGSSPEALGRFLSDFDAAHISIEDRLSGARRDAAEPDRRARVERVEASDAERLRGALRELVRSVSAASSSLDSHQEVWKR